MKQLIFCFLAISLAKGDLNYKTDNLTLSECARRSDIYDTDGNYIKSVCETSSELSFENAESFCLSNDMMLFILNDARTEEALEKVLYKFAESNANKSYHAEWWVNGKYDIWEQQWTTVTSKNFLSDELNWNFGTYDDEYEEYIDITDCCLRISNIRGNFSLDNYNCDTRLFSLCEYESRNVYLPANFTIKVETISGGSNMYMFSVFYMLLSMFILLDLSHTF